MIFKKKILTLAGEHVRNNDTLTGIFIDSLYNLAVNKKKAALARQQQHT